MDINQLIQYIPTEEFGEQNDWLFIANVFKAAGVQEDDFRAWCALDHEKYSDDVVARYRSLSPKESREHALNILLKIAGENGYTYKGCVEHLPSVELRPCYRTVRYPNDEELTRFDQEKAQADTYTLLKHLGERFVLADYVNEEFNGKLRIRPCQEKSYSMLLYDFKKDSPIFERFGKPSNGRCFLLNEVDEEKLQQERQEGTSQGVKKEHFVSFDWCLIESDEGSIEEQWQKIRSLNLPLLGIVHSGNKSLHCFCHVGAQTLKEYEKRTKMLMDYCLINGFNVDTATSNINRWVRFPYARRRDKMQYPVKVFENFRTFNQWRKQSVYYCDIFDRKVQRNSTSDAKLEINLDSIMKVLHENGFRRNVSGDVFFKLNGKLVRQVSDGEIHTFLYDWLKTYYPEDLSLFARHKWEPSRLKMLDSIPDERHTDSRVESFFYFRNSAICVTKNGLEKVPYQAESRLVKKRICVPEFYAYRHVMAREVVPGLNGYINAKQMIDHDIKIADSSGDFARFVAIICNDDEARIRALKSALGYLMHRYKNPSLVKAIILTDESLEDQNGGTGKGLLFQALGKMRFCQSADMKTRERNRFFFSTIEKGCSVCHLDDVQENFDFSYLFNVLANDMEIEAKGQNRLVIPFEEAPKIYVSTNFAFKEMQTDSHKRRMAIYELYRKFNARHQPIDEFGRNFFYDWDEKEWNCFYNFMLECSLIYMQEGLLMCEPKYIKQKALRAEFQGREEFLEFIQTWESDGLFDKHVTNDDLSSRWISERGGVVSPISLKKLLTRYCELQGYSIRNIRDAQTRAFIVSKPEKLE